MTGSFTSHNAGTAALPPSNGIKRYSGLFGGVLLALILTLAGWQLANFPGLSAAGPMACTLAVAIVFRRIFGYPEALRPGLAFASTKLLRLAIILYGLKLPIGAVLHGGLPFLARGAAVLAVSLAAGIALGRLLKADRELTLLLAIGTGICGAAAIAASAPLLGAKAQKTALGAGLIAAVGTLFAVAYTLLLPVLPIGDAAFGAWAGLTLHELAHVAMTAGTAGPEAMNDGMLAKLCRVVLLVPLCLALSARSSFLRRREAGEAREARKSTGFPFRPNETQGTDNAPSTDDAPDTGDAPGSGRAQSASRAKPALPWFLLGFLAMSLLGSASPEAWLPLPAGWRDGVSQLTAALFAAAMAGLGLGVNLRDFRLAWRPLLALLAVSLLVSAGVYVTLAF
ncbi:YeiH family protein [Cohnella massiliensis]|uniref:YeiH family protein n=1 Tax=Cohnella massiliensis TaxID=1816691 RepID=UPI0009BA82DD|nr:putative sulfate exporter family transporter [Cohnella massiliensis]